MLKKILICMTLFGCSSTVDENVGEKTEAILRPCLVEYYVSASGNFFSADVYVTNRSTAINGWTLSWLVPSGQTITNGWNAHVSQPAPQVGTATNTLWNASIPTNGYVNFGFNATATTLPVAEPWFFTLNNKQCDVW